MQTLLLPWHRVCGAFNVRCPIDSSFGAHPNYSGLFSVPLYGNIALNQFEWVEHIDMFIGQGVEEERQEERHKERQKECKADWRIATDQSNVKWA